MCECTPNKRTPVCESCPHELKVKWGLAEGKIKMDFKGELQKSTLPIDRIIELLTEIVKAMDDGGIDEFDLSVGELFTFKGKRNK